MKAANEVVPINMNYNKVKRKFFIIFAVILIFAGDAFAAYISLNTSLTSKIEGNSLSLMVSSTNKGDESAFNVQAELQVSGKNILSKKAPELTVNGTYSTTEKFNVNYAKPGNYPIALTIHYTDANQYPFSALTCQTVIYRKEAISPVFGKLSSTTISKEGKLKLTLKNAGAKDIKTRVSLVAPRELTVEDKAKELVLGPKSTETIEYEVKNFSALSGSTYQVYAVAEAEDSEMHYTSVVPGTVKITSEGPATIFALIAVIIVLLVLIYVLLNYFSRKKRS